MSENTVSAGMLGDLPGTMLGIVRDKALDAGVLSRLGVMSDLLAPALGASIGRIPRRSRPRDKDQK